MFEQEYEKLLIQQRNSASGTRLELLKKDMVGEKKMLKELIWPVFNSFDGFILEHEITSLSGVKMYIDVFYEPFKLAFESEGFAGHSEMINRNRFDFERMRVRTMAMYGYTYLPVTWDELDKKSEQSRRDLYGLMGRLRSSLKGELSMYEREIVRFGLSLNRPFRITDVQACLELGKDKCRRIIKELMVKKLISPLRGTPHRCHYYVVNSEAILYIR